jgi:hypothetical protein
MHCKNLNTVLKQTFLYIKRGAQSSAEASLKIGGQILETTLQIEGELRTIICRQMQTSSVPCNICRT